MKNHEKWIELCEQAATEQDPEKLMHLTAEICRLLDEKNARLRNLANSETWSRLIIPEPVFSLSFHP